MSYPVGTTVVASSLKETTPNPVAKEPQVPTCEKNDMYIAKRQTQK